MLNQYLLVDLYTPYNEFTYFFITTFVSVSNFRDTARVWSRTYDKISPGSCQRLNSKRSVMIGSAKALNNFDRPYEAFQKVWAEIKGIFSYEFYFLE